MSLSVLSDHAPSIQALPPLSALPELLNQSPFNTLTHKNRDSEEHLQIRAANDYEAVMQWLSRFEHKITTFRAYQKEADRLLLWCYQSSLALGQCDVTHIEQYLQFIKNPMPKAMWCQIKIGGRGHKRGMPDWKPFAKPLTAQGVYYAYQVLMALFGYLVEAGYLKRNPVKLIKLKSHHNRNDRIFEVYERIPTPEEWQAIVQVANTWSVPQEQVRMRFILAMLFYTGLRISELAQLTWSAFRKTQNGWSLFVIGKGDKKREIAVERLLQEVMRYRRYLQLSLFPKVDEHTPVIRDLEGKNGIQARQIFSIVKTITRKASEAFAENPVTAKRLRCFSPHWVRHLCPSLLTQAGVDVRYIQEMLGHASSQTTNIYVHLFDQERRKAVRCLNLIAS